MNLQIRKKHNPVKLRKPTIEDDTLSK